MPMQPFSCYVSKLRSWEGEGLAGSLPSRVKEKRKMSVRRAGLLGAGPGLGTERREEGRKESPDVPRD